MRQVPRSPLSFKLQRVANVPEHPPPSTRLMSCAHIANRRLSRIIGARWLEHQEQRRQAKLMKARQTPSIVDDKDRTRHCPGKVQVNLMRRRASPVTAGLQGSIDDEDDNNNKQFPSLNEV